MKNINLKLIQNGFVKFRSIGFAICMMFTIQNSYATISGPTGAAAPTTDACQANAATSIQSVSADITLLQSLYSSDCGSLTFILSTEGPSMDPADDDCSWEYFRNYTINESGGSTCNQVITVTVEHLGGDVSAPTGSFGPIMGVNDCLANVAAFDAAGVAAAYSDNCSTLDASDVALTGTTTSGDDCNWTVTYDYTVTDDCTNSVTGSYSVFGADGNAPTFNSASAYSGTPSVGCQPTTASAFDSSKALLGYSDDCSTSLTATETGTASIGGDDCNWTVTYTYDVSDGCSGNITSGSYSETGSDGTAPALTGTAYSGTDINGCGPSAAPGFISGNALMGYTDNCAAATALTATMTGTPVTTNDGCDWTVTYSYTVSDGCNTTSGSYMEEGSDMTDPTAVTQTPGTYDIDATSCSVTVDAADIDNGSTDNCSAVTLLISKDGMSASAAASVVLSDGPGADFDLSANCPAFDDVFLHVIDACGNETISPAVTISITANASTLSFPTSPIYDDVTKPIVGSDCNQNVGIQKPVVTTACGISNTPTISTPGITPEVNFVDAGSQWIGDFPLGTTLVEVSVADDCGNVFTDTHNVTVTDGINPQVTFCPSIADVSTTATATTCDVSVMYSDATATDNCGFHLTNGMKVTFTDGSGGANTPANYPAMYTASPTSGNARTVTLDKGVTKITWTFLDASGNSNTCVQNVTVSDATLPTTTLPTFPAITSVAYNTSTAGVTCPSTGTSLAAGTQNVGFASTFTVAGQTITAPAVGDFADNCLFDATTATLNAKVTTTPASPTCSAVVTIEWDVEDCGGNNLADKVIYKYTITDNSPPSLTGTAYTDTGTFDGCKPASTMLADIPMSLRFSQLRAMQGYEDNCGTVTATLTNTNITGVDDCAWTITYTYDLTDGCGAGPTNTITGLTYSHNGGDDTGPTGNEPTDVTGINACMPTSAGALSLYFDKIAIATGYTDICSGQSVAANIINESAVLSTGSSDCNWTVTFEYDVEDACNKKLEDESFTVSGGDMTKPSNNNPVGNLTDIDGCSDSAAALAAVEAASSQASEKGLIAAANTDNCGPMPITNVVLSSEVVTGMDCQSAGGWTVTRTYNVVDACNIMSDDIVVVHTGYSQTGPTFSSMHPDVSASGSAGCNALVDIIKPVGNTSQCGSTVTLGLMVPAGVSVSDDGNHWTLLVSSGITTVSIVATDGCGNQSFDDVDISVSGSVPTFNGPGANGCPNNIVDADGVCSNPYTFNISAQENCGTTGSVVDVQYSNFITPSNRTSVAINTNVSDQFFQGITTVTLTLRNPTLGSSSSCSFTITVPSDCGTSQPDPCQPITEVVSDDIIIGTPLALYKSSDITQSDIIGNTTTGTPFTVFPASTGDAGTYIPSTHNVAFYGENAVILHPGFETQLGALFLADIEPCSSLP